MTKGRRRKAPPAPFCILSPDFCLLSMDITLTTPALLFPTVSLLLLAYTNRFLGLAALIRDLYAQYKDTPDERIVRQIENLRRRVNLIRNMQALGVSSMLLCVVCMGVLFAGWQLAGKVIFVISLALLTLSLSLSLREIQISVNALNLVLSDLEDENRRKP